jgi:hypothetical protein
MRRPVVEAVVRGTPMNPRGRQGIELQDPQVDWAYSGRRPNLPGDSHTLLDYKGLTAQERGERHLAEKSIGKNLIFYIAMEKNTGYIP